VSNIAEAVRQMRENGGDPHGILCAGKDRAAMEAYGMPVRVTNYLPVGQAYVVDRATWEQIWEHIFQPKMRSDPCSHLTTFGTPDGWICVVCRERLS
jgi:hypothetical protein